MINNIFKRSYSTNLQGKNLFLMTATGEKTSFWQTPKITNDSFESICCVTEIPNVFSKMQVNKEKKFHPIEQDKRAIQGVRMPRFYQQSLIFNYGFVPQTFESPLKKDIYTNKYLGDNDPLDVIEVSPAIELIDPKRPLNDFIRKSTPYDCRILGSFCLIDQDETDWKVITLDKNVADELNILNIESLKKHVPGYLEYLIHCFKNMKYMEGKKMNYIEFDEKIFNVEETTDIVKHYHDEYHNFLNDDLHKVLRKQFHSEGSFEYL